MSEIPKGLYRDSKVTTVSMNGPTGPSHPRPSDSTPAEPTSSTTPVDEVKMGGPRPTLRVRGLPEATGYPE